MSAWTPNQVHRGEILFRRYPSLEKAYHLAMQLGHIFSKTTTKGVTFTRLAQWYNKVEEAGFKLFNIASRSIQANYLTILNYSDNRSNNASAESFNAKIKALRTSSRGVRDVNFFL